MSIMRIYKGSVENLQESIRQIMKHGISSKEYQRIYNSISEEIDTEYEEFFFDFDEFDD